MDSSQSQRSAALPKSSPFASDLKVPYLLPIELLNRRLYKAWSAKAVLAPEQSVRTEMATTLVILSITPRVT